MAHPMDAMAMRLFAAAARENRCGELLECLFEGGTATFDPTTGKLVMISGEMLADVLERSENP